MKKLTTLIFNIIRSFLVYRNRKKLPAAMEKQWKITRDPELRRSIDGAKLNPRRMLPYEWVGQYETISLNSGRDADGLAWVEYGCNRHYFPNHISRDQAISAVRIGLAEQDDRSPHRYQHDPAHLLTGRTAVLIGASDCLFARSLDGMFKRLVLIEADSQWEESIRRSMIGARSEIEIHRAFVSSETGGISSTMDDLLKNRYTDVDFVQMDIEGYEVDALIGAERILKQNSNLRLSICCYHTPTQVMEIFDFLSARGFSCAFSPGYLNPLTARRLCYPYLRRGVVYAQRRPATN